MDIESLRTFLILSETESFTATAQALFVAQSTVSSRINELEKELKVKLFERTNRTVKLTSVGEKFRKYAQTVTDLTDQTLTGFSNETYEDHIRVGCANTIYECYLKDEIKSFINDNPKDSLMVSIGISKDLNEKLQNGLFDLVYSYIPLQRSKYICKIFKQDKLILVTDINNKKYKSMTVEELIDEKLLMCDFALKEVGEFVRNIFPKYHRFPMEIDDCTKVIPLIKDCGFYTFLPSALAKPLIKSKELREVKLKDFETPVINSYLIVNSEFAKKHPGGKYL